MNERFGCVGVRFVLDVRGSQVPFICNLFVKDAIIYVMGGMRLGG